MTERLRVRFLVAIWGARYIEEFARVSLPSYLSEDNLPFIASETDLEIVVMTTQEGPAKFEEERTLQQLKTLCPVRYIFIDDLIATGVYGVTLTLAFARGIADSGEKQTETQFIFMNSDFVLSNGSLRSLIRELRQGHRCIMAPSLRASSENVLPVLADAIDPSDGIFRMPSRDMVKLAFDNLHPTVVGKTVTQALLTCQTHNQIYWQVDDTTLLGRYHLIFMLAIKPEVPIGPINSYCDYGFVPELVPSGEFKILDDSDTFFMLELQSAAQEKSLLRGGSSTLETIASELTFWTTREHRRFAEVDVVFRSKDLPPNYQAARADFAKLFASLQTAMTVPPVTHIDHFYWVSGVQAWASLKYVNSDESVEQVPLPPELGKQIAPGVTAEPTDDAPPRLSTYAQFHGWAVRTYLTMLGHARMRAERRPHVPIWHHLWLDCRLVLKWVKATQQRPHQNNLFFCNAMSPFASYFHKLPTFVVDDRLSDVISDTVAPDANPHPSEDRLYDNILIHMYRANMRQTRRVSEMSALRLKPGGTVAIYVDHLHSETDPSNFTIEFAQYVDDVLPSNWMGYRVSARFAGGPAKRRLRIAERRLFKCLWPASFRRLPQIAFAVAAWPCIAALMVVVNYRDRSASRDCPEYCSSFLLSLSRPGAG